MRSLGSLAVVTVCLVVVATCARGDDVPQTDGAAAAAASDTTTGMEGMTGMQMGDAALMNRMNTHMAMMRGIGGDSMLAMSEAELQALMPEHDRRVMRLMEMHRTMTGGMAR